MIQIQMSLYQQQNTQVQNIVNIYQYIGKSSEQVT